MFTAILTYHRPSSLAFRDDFDPPLPADKGILDDFETLLTKFSSTGGRFRALANADTHSEGGDWGNQE